VEREFPEAEVTGYEHLIAAMRNHEKDRHVAAAAVKAGAQVITTSNLKDFAELPEGIEAQSPDVFLCNLFDLDPETFVELLREQAADLERAGQSRRARGADRRPERTGQGSLRGRGAPTTRCATPRSRSSWRTCPATERQTHHAAMLCAHCAADAPSLASRSFLNAPSTCVSTSRSAASPPNQSTHDAEAHARARVSSSGACRKLAIALRS
jgi:hypothetical protein